MPPVHHFYDGVVGYLGSAAAGGILTRYLVLAVRALEPPDCTSGKFYRWFYRWTQSALANPDLVEAAKDSSK